MAITTELIESWKAAEVKMKEAKAAELKLRIEIASEIIDMSAGGDYVPGTYHNKEFGMDLVASSSLSQKVDKEILGELLPDLSDLEKAAIRYKPEVAAKEYKKLPKDSILNKAIESKPSETPTLKIKELK